MYPPSRTFAIVIDRPDKPLKKAASKVRRLAEIDFVAELFPQDLLSDDPPRHRGTDFRSGTWWLAHTKPQQEKSVAAALVSREVAFYLPLVSRKSITRGRTRLIRIPLFSGYVFLYGDDEDRLSALKTNRLVTVQPVPDGELLRSQLVQLAELIALGAPLVRESRLARGDRVRVKAGLFRDTQGVVLRRNGRTELLVAIDFLGQGASFEVEDCLLEPV